MKYIKLFENIITDIIEKEEEVKKDKAKVLKLIDEYIMLHKEMWDDWDIGSDYNKFQCNYEYSSDFSLFRSSDADDHGAKYISVEYSYDHGEETGDLSIKLEDFLEFAKDPEMYKNIKKYNL